MWIQPAPGRKVRDPALNDDVPEAGRDVPPSDYWLRRLRDGDVVTVKATPADRPAERPLPDKRASRANRSTA